MIRPFTLRDLALVRRLSEQGISLHAESALTDNLQPFRGALLSMLVGGDYPTFVWKAEKGNAAGFIQLILEDNKHHAHIHFISPQLKASTPEDLYNGDSLATNATADDNIWLPLLDQAVVEAGTHGIHSLVAEVDETGAELPILRRAGFAVYTRQDIWLLKEKKQEVDSNGETITQRQPIDDWDIQLLYANTVPRLVQLVEPLPPLAKGKSWVYHDGNELAAFVQIHEGAVATWLRFFIHPKAEPQANVIVAAALKAKPPSNGNPVYCCVRRYESWLPSALERNGFELMGRQAVMVKHTVHYIRKPMKDLTAVIEKQGYPIPTPYQKMKK